MEDKLSKTLRKNVYFVAKYIENVSLKKLHQLNIMDNTVLHKTHRHVSQINRTITCIKSEILAFLIPI